MRPRMVHEIRRSASKSRIVTVTSYLPISGKSLSDSRSMCTTKVSPAAVTGSPVASWSIPDESTATWPCGSQSRAKTSAAGAAMSRSVSMRVVSDMRRSWHGYGHRHGSRDRTHHHRHPGSARPVAVGAVALDGRDRAGDRVDPRRARGHDRGLDVGGAEAE